LHRTRAMNAQSSLGCEGASSGVYMGLRRAA
jgi:hypothetical protein